MQAVILAGGFGTRLGELVKDKPKPMMDINGHPFLEYLIKYLKKIGITKFILCTGYKHESIAEYFTNGSKFGIEISYSREYEPLGTGGAIKNALSLLNDVFLLQNGDSITFFNLNDFYDFHKTHNSCSVLAVNQENSSRYGGIVLGQNALVEKFHEKNSGEKDLPVLINAGTYIVRKDVILLKNFNDNFSLEKDLLPNLVYQKKLYAYATKAYFCDIGIPEDLARFRQDSLGIDL